MYMFISALLLVLETILQLCVIGTHSLSGHEGVFIALLAAVAGPVIIVNIVSAVNVIRTNDFSGRNCGRAICITSHSVQLGIVWRAFTLLVAFNPTDWTAYVNMRLFHCGFQSLPFSILLCYQMFVTETSNSLSIVTMVFSLISASVALVIHRAETLLYKQAEETEHKPAAKLPIGVAFLTFSTFLVLTSRSLSIALFSVSETFWIFVPLALHYIIHIIIEICKPSCKDQGISCRITSALYVSFVNVFDMVGKGYSGVKCSYVLYYTFMLVENLTFSFYWMLTAVHGEQFKLFLVLAMLLCFIIGLMIKFASCGSIFDVQSDILSDAFNNPELGGGVSKVKELEPIRGGYEPSNQLPNYRIYEIQDVDRPRDVVDAAGVTLGDYTDPELERSGLSPKFRRAHRSKGEYINAAFVQSQGNLSVHSRVTNGSNKVSAGSNSKRQSKHSQGASSGSKAGTDHLRTPKSKVKVKQGSKHSGAELSDSFHIELTDATQDIRGSPAVPITRHNEKPTIIVSDTSKHASLQRNQHIDYSMIQASNGNLTLASSHSKYSRNTHTMHGTLNGSVMNYGYNGFDDPYREAKRKGKTRTQHNRRHDHSHRNTNRRFPRNMDYSLDSSDLYPSVTSDSSSVSTLTDDRRRRRARQRMDYRRRKPRSHDGYSSDVSNSDYVSFNDYSMGDSSSWTESSESSSDGAATWPPSHTTNLLKTFNVIDKESSTENILHWLNNMEADIIHDASFSTLNEPSLASDTDISLSAMQTFEVKKEKRKFKRLMSKPKGLFHKFSSLNYKGKDIDMQQRQFPLKKKGPHNTVHDTKGGVFTPGPLTELQCRTDTINHAMPLPGDIVQESIV